MAFANTLFVNPARPSWDLGAFRLLADRRPAEGDSGGDFYAFALRGPKRLAVVIGDACGRGREGASLLPGVLDRIGDLVATRMPPSQLLESLNQGLCGRLASDRFVTSAAFEIDGNAGTLTVANAGHVPALLRRASGEVRIVGRASGPPLGMFPESHYCDETTCRLGSGDVIVLMSDGILEAVETDLQGMPKLTAALGKGGGGGSAALRRVLSELPPLRAKRDADDMMLLSLELLPQARVATLAGLQAVA
jgi:serine phosphatase RsbU (regulator of sigma subunit)